MIADYQYYPAPYTLTAIQHRNAVTGQWVKNAVRTEIDPLGADVGYINPYLYNMTYSDIMGSDNLYYIRGNALDIRGGCALDGMSISCSLLNEMMASETGSVALQYQLNDGTIVAEQGTIKHFGAGIFIFDYPTVEIDNEPGTSMHRLAWRFGSFYLLPQTNEAGGREHHPQGGANPPCDVVLNDARVRATVAVALGEGTPFASSNGRPNVQLPKEQDGGRQRQLTEPDFREEAYYMASVIVNRFNGGGYEDYNAVVNEEGIFLGIDDGWERINQLGTNGSEYCERARYIVDALNYIDRQGGPNNNFRFWRGVAQPGLPGGRRAFRQGDQRAANTDFMSIDPISPEYRRLPYLTVNGWRVPRR